MRQSIAASAGIAAAGLLLASAAVPAASPAQGPQWPAGAADKSDRRVLAFYDDMCAQYADRQGLTGDARDDFISGCRTSIPRVFPVGYDEASGGEE